MLEESIADNEMSRGDSPSVSAVSPFFGQFVVASCASVVNAACQIALVKVLAVYLGVAGLGVYMLIRRIVTQCDPITLLNLQYAMPKRVAEVSSVSRQREFLFAGALASLVLPAIMLVASLFFADSLGEYLFKSAEMSSYVLIVAFLLVSNSIYGILYGYFRGRLKVLHLACFQLLMVAVGPLLLAFVVGKSFGLNGFLWSLVGLGGIALVQLLVEVMPVVVKIENYVGLWRDFKKLASYAIPRIPAQFLIAGISSIGVIWVAARAGVASAGFLAAGLMLINLCDVGLSGLVTILLPKAAGYRNDHDKLMLRVSLVCQFAIVAGLFAGCSLWLWSDVLVGIWLGPDYAAVAAVVRILSLAVPFYVVYLVLIGVIEGITEKPVVTMLHSIGFLVMSVGLGFATYRNGGLQAAALFCSAGYASLGIATFVYMKIRQLLNVSLLSTFGILVLNALILWCGYLLKPMVVNQGNKWATFVLAMVVVVVGFVLYISVLFAFRHPLVQALSERVPLLRGLGRRD